MTERESQRKREKKKAEKQASQSPVSFFVNTSSAEVNLSVASAQLLRERFVCRFVCRFIGRLSPPPERRKPLFDFPQEMKRLIVCLSVPHVLSDFSQEDEAYSLVCFIGRHATLT
jgi:hypothetical protein